MKLGLTASYFGKEVNLNLDLIKYAEELDYDSTWTAEAYGGDAVTADTWILANTSKI